MKANPNLAHYAADKDFVQRMTQFQGREKAMAIKESIMSIPGMDDVALETLEAMVGITPEMVAAANGRWDEEQAREQSKMGDAVVEVHSTQG